MSWHWTKSIGSEGVEQGLNLHLGGLLLARSTVKLSTRGGDDGSRTRVRSAIHMCFIVPFEHILKKSFRMFEAHLHHPVLLNRETSAFI